MRITRSTLFAFLSVFLVWSTIAVYYMLTARNSTASGPKSVSREYTDEYIVHKEASKHGYDEVVYVDGGIRIVSGGGASSMQRKVSTRSDNCFFEVLSEGQYLQLRDAKRRGVSREVRYLSYSLFGGENPRYTVGAIRNVELRPTIYKDWHIRFYIDSPMRHSPSVEKLIELGAEVYLVHSKAGGCGPGPMWRFFIFGDPIIDRVIVRDTDSRISFRERAAVDEWILSGYKYHIMRDHPMHTEKMLAGMWGAVTDGMRDFPDIILSNVKDVATFGYGFDQAFMATNLWSRVQFNHLTHDSYHCVAFNGTSFPTKRVEWRFVGEVYLIDNDGVENPRDVDWQYMTYQQIPPECADRNLATVHPLPFVDGVGSVQEAAAFEAETAKVKSSKPQVAIQFAKPDTQSQILHQLVQQNLIEQDTTGETLFMMVAPTELIGLQQQQQLMVQQPRHNSTESSIQTAGNDPFIVFLVHIATKEGFQSVEGTWLRSLLEKTTTAARVAAVVFYGNTQVIQVVQHSLYDNSRVRFLGIQSANDAHKLKAAVDYAYSRFPAAVWYVSTQETTYVYTFNLIRGLQIYRDTALTTPYLIGFPIILKSSGLCFASTSFMAVNNAALQRISPLSKRCRDIGAEEGGPFGDLTLSQCLYTVPETPVLPLMILGIHPHAAESMAVFDSDGGVWDTPDGLRQKPTGWSALRPISYYFIGSARMKQMHDNRNDYFAFPFSDSESSAKQLLPVPKTSTKRTRTIPKTMHLIHVHASGDSADNAERRFQTQLRACKRANPNWEVKQWTNETMKKIPMFFNARHVSIPTAETPKAQRKDQLQRYIDALKYDILYHFGGIVLDPRVQCSELQPFDALVDEFNREHTTSDALFVSEDKQTISDTVIGALQYSETMMLLVRSLDKTDWSAQTAREATGAQFITRTIEETRKYLPVAVLNTN